MNHLHNPKNIQFQVRARHSTLYMVDLPSFLPDSIVDQLILDFTTKLQSELLEAMNVISAGDNEPGSIRPTHKSKKENQSFESIASAITVSTEGGSVDAEYADDLQNKYDAILPKVTTEGGSVDCEAAVKEQ
jgi:hypothetical protein